MRARILIVNSNFTSKIPLIQVFRLVRVVNGHYEKIYKPRERILVHGFDVGQVSNGEEQNG